jgi:hypothetical protein
MNIQISGLPENQKIKSINFNIVFDDSNIDTNPTVSVVPEAKTSNVITNVEAQKAADYYNSNLEDSPEVTSEMLKPVDIDISKREPKVDPNMLEELF